MRNPQVQERSPRDAEPQPRQGEPGCAVEQQCQNGVSPAPGDPAARPEAVEQEQVAVQVHCRSQECLGQQRWCNLVERWAAALMGSSSVPCSQGIVLLQTPHSEHRDLREETEMNPHPANADLPNCWGTFHHFSFSFIFFLRHFFRTGSWMQPTTIICARNKLREGFKDSVWQSSLLTTDIKCSLSWLQLGSISPALWS